MKSPRPYNQKVLRDGTILREFKSEIRDDELVWHQDREHRSVRVIESGGWKLQLEEGLPFPLVDGNTYEIAERSWHRLIRGPGNLKIEIQEGTKMRITESQLRKVIREVIKESNSGLKLEKFIWDENPDLPKSEPAQPKHVISLSLDEITFVNGIYDPKISGIPKYSWDEKSGIVRKLGVGSARIDFPFKEKAESLEDAKQMILDDIKEELKLKKVFIESNKKTKNEKKNVKTREYQGKTYTASAGSLEALKKHGGSMEDALAAGAFDWAEDPEAAAQAAHIVLLGKPSVSKGSKRG